MSRLLALLSLLAVLSLAACGGDDEDPTTTTAGATGATGADGIFSGDVETAGDYMQASIPDQVESVERVVEAIPACDGVDPKAGDDFHVGVAIAAAQASPETPLADIVTTECEEE